MRKILFDFITFEDQLINGGMLYAKQVFTKLIEQDVKIYGICRCKEQLNKEIVDICNKNNVEILIFDKDLNNIVKQNEIDVFFIGIAQRYNEFDLSNLQCKIFIVCHDLVEISLYNAKLDGDYEKIIFNHRMNKIRFPHIHGYVAFVKRIFRDKSILGIRVSNKKVIKRLGYNNFDKLIKKPNVFIITVSEYSKSTIQYFFDDIANDITVLYPPLNVSRKVDGNIKMEGIIENKPYFLLMSTNRITKNAEVFLEQFDKLNGLHKNKFHAILIGVTDTNFKNVIGFEKVSKEELEYLISNAYCLVYPSLGEGFGQPPVEAMAMGIPVIVAYNTSIPEVCGKDCLYFNPLYPEDLFFKENMLINNYDKYVEVSKKRFEYLFQKQKDDFNKLIEIILKS